MGGFEYVGSELDLFRDCTRWKQYFSSQLRPHIGRDVVEIGAGMGANTSFLKHAEVRTWVCVEPDAALAEQILLANATLNVQVRVGVSGDVFSDGDLFDTAIYIDVLEHIEDDKAEVATICRRLRPGGKLVVLGPAHNYLFSPFDAAIGHYRRYDAGMMKALEPSGMKLVTLRYLDAVGLFASLANRLLLKQSMPTRKQLAAWDRFMVPLSGYVDPVLGYRFGKSIFGVWEKID
jgi:2-polyprenyl-3-methyl-5-hydroxy-6-metoxy-1,4-benzoquinol methylase